MHDRFANGPCRLFLSGRSLPTATSKTARGFEIALSQQRRRETSHLTGRRSSVIRRRLGCLVAFTAARLNGRCTNLCRRASTSFIDVPYLRVGVFFLRAHPMGTGTTATEAPSEAAHVLRPPQGSPYPATVNLVVNQSGICGCTPSSWNLQAITTETQLATYEENTNGDCYCSCDG